MNLSYHHLPRGLVFTPEEFDYLHRDLLKSKTKGQLFRSIKKKRGFDLNNTEKQYIKNKFKRREQ